MVRANDNMRENGVDHEAERNYIHAIFKLVLLAVLYKNGKVRMKREGEGEGEGGGREREKENERERKREGEKGEGSVTCRTNTIEKGQARE